jgi:hypothetical protein
VLLLTEGVVLSEFSRMRTYEPVPSVGPSVARVLLMGGLLRRPEEVTGECVIEAVGLSSESWRSDSTY